MKSISVLLENIIVVSQQAEIVEEIKDFFLEFFSADINIEYRKGKLFLEVPPVLRSEIFLQKNKIKKLLEERLRSFNIKITKII